MMKEMGVLNMLNMKYLIFNPNARPLVNPEANGNAWFIDTLRWTANADEEMKLVGEVDTKRELVVDNMFKSDVSELGGRDTAATISLKSYAPNRLVYKVHSSSRQIAVFSEIYYKDGWNAYIDGEKVPYFRADYLLRAMSLDAGNYEVEFRFEPSIVRTSKTLSLVSSVLFVLLAAYCFWIWRRKQQATGDIPTEK